MAFNKKTIKDIDVNGKTVLVRASLNVPIKNNKVVDDLRLKALLPTLKYLLDKKAKLVLMSHHSSDGQSLAPVAPVLTDLLSLPVKFVDDSVGPKVAEAVKSLKPGQVMVLENLRFHKGEEANDPVYVKKLAALGDAYVDDDFTATHREHASVVGIPKLLPGVAGLQILQEVDTITKAMENPKRPLLVVVGGTKISTKIDFLDNFIKKAQAIFIGGAMANTFLGAQGLEVGKSLVEESEYKTAQKVMALARDRDVQLFLPIDVVVTDDLDKATKVRVVAANQIGKSDIVADLGPRSVAAIQSVLNKKGTVIWNGPLGVAEISAFAKGSKDIAKRITDSGATSIVGGGDTAGFIDSIGWHDKFSFISTGGGASLELMSGKKLPGVEALLDK